jgi:hypothetical protein
VQKHGRSTEPFAVYVAPPYLKQPPDTALIWRYMTPTSFLAIVLGRRLYFPTLGSLEDPFEGAPPTAVLKALRAPQQRQQSDQAGTRQLQRWREMLQLSRTTVCVSSWYVGDEESEAMWKLHGRFEDGVAIVSTLASIRPCFEQHDVTGGLVDYVDADFEPGTADENLLRWATIKRPSYRHESEFRLLTRCNDHTSGGPEGVGVALPIDPRRLIERIVLSPRMQAWQVELFRTLLARLQFDVPLTESSLLTSPI